jgi:mannose-1-phosphate guanylyltransferase/phosphomannomutase
MKAFILAAGVGNRLKPLTQYLPKPMVPILNKPALYHIISNLSAHGISEAKLNLYYQPQSIKNYFGTEFKGVKLSYSVEKQLLGTAGAIKKNESFFDDTFIVMSGDGLTDINLKRLVNYHKKKGALATLALKKIDARFEYGVGVRGKGGEITKFVEKPSWADFFSNTVNTGIYVFEPEIFKYIPNKVYDFGRDVIPKLLEKKLPVYGYVMDEYWTDIGNLNEYKGGTYSALSKKLKINFSGIEIKKGIYAGKTSKISKKAKLFAPCVIGENCIIEEGVIVKPCSVIGDNVTIGRGAVLDKTIVWDGTKIGRKVHLESSIIGYNVTVSDGIHLYDSAMMSNE